MQVELTWAPANSPSPTLPSSLALPSSGGADSSALPFAALLQIHAPKGAAEATESQSKDVQEVPLETPPAETESPGESLIEAWIKKQNPAPLLEADKTDSERAAAQNTARFKQKSRPKLQMCRRRIRSR